MVRSVLKDFLEKEQALDLAKCEWHQQLINYWDPDSKINRRNRRLTVWERERDNLKDQLTYIFEKHRNDSITHFFEPASFPFGQPRNSLRRPDIIEFIDWFDNVLEIKPLILYRDPVSVAYSGLRRNFTKDWRLQAKIVEDNYLYIKNQIQASGEHGYRVMIFEDFLKAPETFVDSLADWWKIPPDIISRGIKNIIQPTSKDKIPVKIRNSLESFFSEKRIAQWARLCFGPNKLRRDDNAN